MPWLPHLTVRELVAALSALPPEQQDRPALVYNGEMQQQQHVSGVNAAPVEDGQPVEGVQIETGNYWGEDESYYTR